MTMIPFDEETSRRVEAIYTTPDVVEQRRVVHRALALRPGERVLDVGSGPGLLAAEMAAEVALLRSWMTGSGRLGRCVVKLLVCQCRGLVSSGSGFRRM